MKAISLRQPWARAVADGHKTVENRGRATTYRGLVAVHASKAVSADGDRDPRIIGLYGPHASAGQPTGAVIAVADLIDCHQAVHQLGTGQRPCCWPWGDTWYRLGNGSVRPAQHLVLAHVRPLNVPVSCRGQVQMPWNLPEDVAAKVMAHV